MQGVPDGRCNCEAQGRHPRRARRSRRLPPHPCQCFVISYNYEMRPRPSPAPLSKLPILKALASDKRLLILHYLKDPTTHFPRQIDGDLVEDGVCADFIREKLGISAATATQHLKVLAAAGLI